MSDRKYRQPGYMDTGRDKQPKASGTGGGPQPRSQETFGPRAINMPGTRTVSRCAMCGVVLQSITADPGQCPKCGFALHSCKQCTHFDPASRLECNQPITARVAKKDAANDCQFYSMKVMVEKETSTASATPSDARRAFENLFKK